MDKKVAKELLVKHKEALDILLESEGMGDIKVGADKALKVAEEGTKQFNKTLLEKFREFPIVEKISSLGTAGTVAVSTAAVTQTELAVDMTQVFVAEVAEDVVEERFVYCTVLRQLPREELGHSWKFECLFILVANSKLIIVRHLYETDVLNLLKGTSSTHHFLQEILSYLVIWR